MAIFLWNTQWWLAGFFGWFQIKKAYIEIRRKGCSKIISRNEDNLVEGIKTFHFLLMQVRQLFVLLCFDGESNANDEDEDEPGFGFQDLNVTQKKGCAYHIALPATAVYVHDLPPKARSCVAFSSSKSIGFHQSSFALDI